MDIETLRQRKYLPKWGDNDKAENPWTVVFTPPTVGEFDAYRLAVADTEGSDYVKKHNAACRALLEACIVEHQGLMNGGKAVTNKAALDFIASNTSLFDELINHFYSEATLTKDEGKK